MPTTTLRLSGLSLTGILGLTILAVPSGADAQPAYVRSTDGAPWGETTNEQAMDLVFGAAGWDDLRYQTVDPTLLFSATYTFIYLEGSDNNALELAAFLTANQAALETWVNGGGKLLLNSAPNEGGNIDFGFGGVLLNDGDFPTDPGSAANPAHPIWNGPFLPTALSFTGDAYAHASISGPASLNPLIIDSDGGNPQAAEMVSGSGRIIFGGMTTTNFWTPSAESLNLRANMISYLDNFSCGDGVVDDGEECDDMGESAACNTDCTLAMCGDGQINMTAGETCDDAGESETCDDDCTAVECGDGVTNATAGEACDGAGESADCNADCTAAMCGDGIVNNTAGETCDEMGVRTATCNTNCTAATCGDGVLNTTAGEECDDGGASASCDDDCTLAMCGDGVTNAEAGEECDDGNTDEGDGCSSTCTDEGGGTTGDTDTGSDTDSGGTTDSAGDSSDSSDSDPSASDSASASGATATASATAGDGSGSSGAASDSDSGGGGSANDGGSSCSVGSTSGTPGLWLGMLGLLGLRRRRRSA